MLAALPGSRATDRSYCTQKRVRLDIDAPGGIRSFKADGLVSAAAARAKPAHRSVDAF